MLEYRVYELKLFHSFSLKDKRSIKRSIYDKVRQNFNISIAEIDKLDVYDTIVFAMAMVSNSFKYIEKEFQKIEKMIISNYDVDLYLVYRE